MTKATSVFLFIAGGQDAFREFLKSEFSDENIEFWLACEDYKKTQADCLHGKAEKIYKEFVQNDATKQVSLKLGWSLKGKWLNVYGSFIWKHPGAFYRLAIS